MTETHFAAAEVLRRHVQNLEAMRQAADVLESIGSLDQAQAEYAAQAAKAREAVKAAGRDLVEANGRIDDARAEAVALVARGKAEADGLILDARAKASELLALAQRSANAANASAVADGELAAKAREEEATTRERIARLDSDAAAIEERIAKAKAQVKALFG